MKNVVCAWGTIVMMAAGTVGAATYAAQVEHDACDQLHQPAPRAKRVRHAAEPAPVLAPEGAETADEPRPRVVKPAPKTPIDTRLLSRVSRRQV